MRIELSWLDAERLDSLVEQSFYAREIGTVDAFLLAFDHTAQYDSPNYLWFSQRFPRFVYIDRVRSWTHSSSPCSRDRDGGCVPARLRSYGAIRQPKLSLVQPAVSAVRLHRSGPKLDSFIVALAVIPARSRRGNWIALASPEANVPRCPVGVIETSAALGACLLVLTAAVALDRRPYRPGKRNYVPIMIIAVAVSLVLGRHLLSLMGNM
jgi:hypothetical protein